MLVIAEFIVVSRVFHPRQALTLYRVRKLECLCCFNEPSELSQWQKKENLFFLIHSPETITVYVKDFTLILSFIFQKSNINAYYPICSSHTTQCVNSAILVENNSWKLYAIYVSFSKCSSHIILNSNTQSNQMSTNRISIPWNNQHATFISNAFPPSLVENAFYQRNEREKDRSKRSDKINSALEIYFTERLWRASIKR